MKYTLAFLILISSMATYGQQPWKLKKDKNGIRVYSRQSERSSFKSVKVEVELEGTIHELNTILMDVENYSNWVYATKESRRIKTISVNEFIYYSIIDVPWPATNRDSYSKAKITLNSSEATLKMFTEGLPDYGKREKKLVRILQSEAKWQATGNDSNTIDVVYVLDTNPGGNLPSWLINLFSSKGPYKSFKNLKKRMQQ